MKMILLTQYFPPEPGSVSIKMAELAEYLARKGHRITVVTSFPNYPTGKFYKGYRVSLIRKERKILTHDEKEIQIIRVPLLPTSKRKSFIHRTVNHGSFMISATYGGLLAGKPDLIYFRSPPPFLGVTSYVLKRLFKVPVIMELTDLWPEAPIALGVIKNRLLIEWANRFVKSVYNHVDFIFFYSNKHREEVLNLGIPRNKTEIHPLWVDTELFKEQDKEEIKKNRLKYGLNKKFVIMYAGLISYAQGLDVVIDAAIKLRNHPDIAFVFVGDGPHKDIMVQKAKEEKLSNIIFIPFQPLDEIPTILSMADVLLAHLSPAPHRLGTIPEKVLAYMSMGKPLLVGCKGETADLVRRSGSGIVFKPGDSDELVKGILSILNNKERDTMGKKGREYAVANFDKRKVLADLEKRLVEIAYGKLQRS